MHSPVSIEPFAEDHWEAVSSVYLEGIATGNATFEQTAPDWIDWDAEHLPSCRIVARVGQNIIGWAALSAASRRPAYRGVAEVSVYVAEAARGRGVGATLISRLILDSEAEGFWTLQSGIFPENVASIKLHSKAGFRVVGTRARLGWMNGSWRDVVLMERRSSQIGT